MTVLWTPVFIAQAKFERFARRYRAEACSSYFLPRAVGISKALEWCYSGKVFPAQKAMDGGLLRSLHEPDELLTQAGKLPQKFVTRPLFR